MSKQEKELSTKYIPLLKRAIKIIEENGYTKVQVAKVSGLSRPTVLRILSGDTKLRLPNVISFIKGVDKIHEG